MANKSCKRDIFKRCFAAKMPLHSALNIMMKLREIIFTLSLLFSSSLWANIEVFDYQVLDFKPMEKDHYLIIIKKVAGPAEPYTVHVQFRPQCYSRMDYKTSVAEERAMFNQAIATITEVLKESNVITLGRKSGTGFLPLSGKNGEHIAESMRLLNTGKEVIPYFQHHDLGWGLCKNA